MSRRYYTWGIVVIALVGILFSIGPFKQAKTAASLSLGGAAALLAREGEQAASTLKYPLKWRMVTSWPKDFPVVGTGANELAQSIMEMSGGRIAIRVYGAGELAGGLDVLDLVLNGGADLGHSASFYWRGKLEALQIFGAIPYGMTATEMNAWLYAGGGVELWEELYAQLGILPFPAGQTGVQMGGWFNKELRTLKDLVGVRMRIPGLGGEVFTKMGGIPVVLPAGEIFTSLTSGALDAAEWSGPANDLPQGFHQAATYYYYPGWQEPTTTVELLIKRAQYHALPADLQAIIRYAAQAANMSMSADYTYRNARGLAFILDQHKNIALRPFPNEVLVAAKKHAKQILASLEAKDAMFGTIYASYKQFLAETAPWSAVSEGSYLRARSDVLKIQP